MHPLPPPKSLHIGQEIERVLKQKQMDRKSLAVKAELSDLRVTEILNSATVEVTDLAKISTALQFDFLRLVSLHFGILPAMFGSDPAKVVALVELDGTDLTLQQETDRLKELNIAIQTRTYSPPDWQ